MRPRCILAIGPCDFIESRLLIIRIFSDRDNPPVAAEIHSCLLIDRKPRKIPDGPLTFDFLETHADS